MTERERLEGTEDPLMELDPGRCGYESQPLSYRATCYFYVNEVLM